MHALKGKREFGRRQGAIRLPWWFSMLVLILGIVALASVWITADHVGQIRRKTFSQIGSISELTTLRCYYHNVAELEKEPDGLFRYGLFQYGYKKLWIEYTGTVELGIDFDEVKISPVGKDLTVKVYVPPATVKSVNFESDSLGTVLTESGVLTQISDEDERDAFAEAQNNMEQSAQNNTALLLQAHQRAKQLIHEYIVNIGKQMNTAYTVEWVDDPSECI